MQARWAWEREVASQLGTAARLLVVEYARGSVRWALVAQDVLGRPPLADRQMSVLGAARLPFDDGGVPGVLLSLVGAAPDAAGRQSLLREIRRVLAPAGRVFVVDHNRPRGRLAALCAVFATPTPRGVSPAGRWRRLAHPTAREVQQAGLVVDSLRLLNHERIQLIAAH